MSQLPARLTAEQQGQIVVTVRNFGGAAGQQLAVELFVDEQSRGTRSVLLPAAETVTVSFPVQI